MYGHIYTANLAGCAEGREERKLAYEAERAAKERLTAANVSAKKQKFLETLVFMSDMKAHNLLPCRDMDGVRYNISEHTHRGDFVRLKRMAKRLNAPDIVLSYLSTLVRMSSIRTRRSREKRRRERKKIKA